MTYALQPSSSRRRRPAAAARRGFTLVELLVVIGIIAVLMGILLPALGAAIESGKTAACLSNLRQLGQGQLMYTNANKGFMVYGGTWSAPDGAGTRFTAWCGSYMLTDDNSFNGEDGFLFPFLGTAKISGCPNHNSETRLYYGPVDYAYNAVYMGNCPTGGSVAPFLGAKATSLRDSTRTAMFWDSARLSAGQLQRTFIGYPTTYPLAGGSAVQGPNFNGRHRGGYGNVVWADGHGETMKPAMYGRDITADNVKFKLGDIDEDGDDTTDELYTLGK